MTTRSARGPVNIPVGLVILTISACGGGGGGGSGTTFITAKLALFAGNMGGPGTADGPSAIARFSGSSGAFGIATDNAGNIYVADQGNDTVRKISPDGEVSTLAGAAGSSGSADGTGAAARFDFPGGIAADNAGNVYVADSLNNTVRKIASDGAVSTLAGTSGSSGSADETGAAARFSDPQSIATDNAGNLYVADTKNNTVRKITSNGVVSTLAGVPGSTGSADGVGIAARFNSPCGIASDSVGNLYVADTLNRTVRKIAPDGAVSTLAGVAGSEGSADGTGAAARFFSPAGIATDSSGNVYVADTFNSTVRKITPAGAVSTLAGVAGSEGTADGTGAEARFNLPAGIATDNSDNVYVSDDNGTIRKITPGAVVTTAAGAPAALGYADGTGGAARFSSPTGVAADNAGGVYVADTATIRAITPGAVVTTVAGTPDCSYADGIGAAARFCHPSGMATDGRGNLYVADSTYNIIRKIMPGGVVSTLAGASYVIPFDITCLLDRFSCCEYADGIATAAKFCNPSGVATDQAGNVYVTDSFNFTVRKIASNGVVTTLAGAAGSAGSTDGTGAAARFMAPQGIATDSMGNVYVSDANAIRKITVGGVVSTLAGTSGVAGSADAVGALARFNDPRGIAIDSADNLYVADRGNSTIRKITPAGVVTTVIGIPGQAGFEPGALPGLLAFPEGAAISGTSLYVTLYNGVAVVQDLL